MKQIVTIASNDVFRLDDKGKPVPGFELILVSAEKEYVSKVEDGGMFAVETQMRTYTDRFYVDWRQIPNIAQDLLERYESLAQVFKQEGGQETEGAKEAA